MQQRDITFSLNYTTLIQLSLALLTDDEFRFLQMVSEDIGSMSGECWSIRLLSAPQH